MAHSLKDLTGAMFHMDSCKNISTFSILREIFQTALTFIFPKGTILSQINSGSSIQMTSPSFICSCITISIHLHYHMHHQDMKSNPHGFYFTCITGCPWYKLISFRSWIHNFKWLISSCKYIKINTHTFVPNTLRKIHDTGQCADELKGRLNVNPQQQDRIRGERLNEKEKQRKVELS